MNQSVGQAKSVHRGLTFFCTNQLVFHTVEACMKHTVKVVAVAQCNRIKLAGVQLTDRQQRY